MNNIILQTSEPDVTVISNQFLDNYMVNANGEFVKVYLYLLRCLSKPNLNLTTTTIADALEHTEKDIIRALKYWDGQGVLTVTFKNNKEVSSIKINQLFSNGTITDTISTRETAVSISPTLEAVQEIISSSEKSEALKNDSKHELPKNELEKLLNNEDIKFLLYIAQTYIGKPLNSTDTNTILYFYNELNFSTELIEYLIEYCVSNSHRSMRYIEKVALDWAKENITTVDEAKEYASSYSYNFYPVLKAFGLSNRNPAAVEKAFIVKWTDEYGFNMDLIVDACNRTINTIQKPSFQYADSILQRWLKKGVKSINDLKSIDDEHDKIKDSKAARPQAGNTPAKTTFNNFPQRTYDYDAVERMLLQKK